MKKSTKKAVLPHSDEMKAEYDFSKGVRGKYTQRLAKGSNIAIISPENAKVFPTSRAINDALRTLTHLAKSKKAA